MDLSYGFNMIISVVEIFKRPGGEGPTGSPGEPKRGTRGGCPRRFIRDTHAQIDRQKDEQMDGKTPGESPGKVVQKGSRGDL